MTRHATSKTEDGRGLVKHALACTPRNLKSYFESRAAHRTTRELQPVVDAEQELLVSASQNPHILRDSFEEDLACILILMKEEMRGSPKHPLASDFGLLYAIYIGIQIAKNANGGPLRPEEVGDIFRSLTDEIRESWLDWPPASEDLSEPPPMWAHFLSRCDGASSEHRDAMAKRLWFVQVTACLATHISLPWTRTKAHVSWPPTLDGSKNRHRQNRIRSDFDVARLHETIDHEALDALAVVLAYVLDHADNLRDFGRSRSGKIFGVLPGEARSPGESSPVRGPLAIVGASLVIGAAVLLLRPHVDEQRHHHAVHVDSHGREARSGQSRRARVHVNQRVPTAPAVPAPSAADPQIAVTPPNTPASSSSGPSVYFEVQEGCLPDERCTVRWQVTPITSSVLVTVRRRGVTLETYEYAEPVGSTEIVFRSRWLSNDDEVLMACAEANLTTACSPVFR